MSGLNITADRAREIADAIDAYDANIKILQNGKRDTFGEVRDELEGLGLDKANVRLELAALKAAITKRAKRRDDADAVEERDALTDSYLDLIEAPAPRATRALAISVPTYPERVPYPAATAADAEAPSGGDTGSAVRAGAPVSEIDASSEVDLTGEALRDLLNYDPETGIFTWANPPEMALRVAPGDRAGRVQNFGYRTIRIGGKDYVEHRLAWLFAFDEWPEMQLDHVNGDKADNRINNLREASPSQNMANRAITSRNKSGVKGASWVASRQKWQAFIRISGRGKFLGYFDDKQDAARAYESAAEKAHGEFAVHNRPESAPADPAPAADERKTPIVKPFRHQDYRPHCRKPDACGSASLDHCFSCKMAIVASEQEAA